MKLCLQEEDKLNGNWHRSTQNGDSAPQPLNHLLCAMNWCPRYLCFPAERNTVNETQSPTRNTALANQLQVLSHVPRH